MKQLLFFALLLLASNAITIAQTANANYDPALADSLGADDYGMKGYTLVILRSGSNTSTDKVFRDSCFTGHMQNIRRLVEGGKLVVAGPLGQNDKTYRGIFIFNVTDFDEVREHLKGDPAITENLLEPELYFWYGSAALPLYLEGADKVWKARP